MNQRFVQNALRGVLTALAGFTIAVPLDTGAQAPAQGATPAIFSPQGARLDRNAVINPALLIAALESFKVHKTSITNQHRMAIADVGSDSRFVRFYIVNLLDGSVRPLVTTHGKGSDPENLGRARQVSNEPGSLATSTGSYVTAEHYYSDKHLSEAVRLDGLDPTNSNARCRCVVVHAANRKDGQNYASADWLRRYGRAGRSDGCLAFAREDIAYVLDRLSPGTFLYVGPASLPSFASGDGKCLCGSKPD